MLLDPLRALTEEAGAWVRWSASVIGADGTVLDDLNATTVLPTASVGKVLLLVRVYADVEAGRLDPAELLPATSADGVADSGLWQFLDAPALSVLDLCRLIGAVSDNLATNVLIGRVGLDRVDASAAELGIRRCRLHDIVRDVRAAEHPPYLSTGAADELAVLARGLCLGEVGSPWVSAAVTDTLRLNTDLSMVAAAAALDPLAHGGVDLGWRLFNKTGTQMGTRADVGVIERIEGSNGGAETISYAVIGRFEDGARHRRAVLGAMGAVGEGLLATLEP